MADGDPSRVALAAIFAGLGSLHFAQPEQFDALIPDVLGRPRAWTYGSGVAELVVAGLLARRRTGRLGGWCALVLLLGVWPGNWKAALDGGYPSFPEPLQGPVVAWIRVPLQLPLLVWAWRLAHRSTAPAR